MTIFNTIHFKCLSTTGNEKKNGHKKKCKNLPRPNAKVNRSNSF